MELDITWKRAFRVWWSFFWRMLILLPAAYVFAGGVGLVLGVLEVACGLPPDLVTATALVVGWCMGMLAMVVAMGLILGKRLGRFRLVLTCAETPVPTGAAQGGPIGASRLFPIPLVVAVHIAAWTLCMTSDLLYRFIDVPLPLGEPYSVYVLFASAPLVVAMSFAAPLATASLPVRILIRLSAWALVMCWTVLVVFVIAEKLEIHRLSQP
jgi:hypothetical protein